jgi:hypothetical protein
VVTSDDELIEKFKEYFVEPGSFKDEKILERIRVENGKICLIDTKLNLIMRKRSISFPFKFGNISCGFDCSGMGLETLSGSPVEIPTTFDCTRNKLYTLMGGPKIVKRHYICYDNPLTDLLGLPDSVGYTFALSWHEQLPLLRLVTLDCTSVLFAGVGSNNDNNDKVTDIIHYCRIYGTSPKKRIWKCQQELIANGYERNAKW